MYQLESDRLKNLDIKVDHVIESKRCIELDWCSRLMKQIAQVKFWSDNGN